MKFDLRPPATRLLTFGKTRVRSIQVALAEGTQAAFRSVRLGLSTITKLSPRSVLLQLLALSATALMTILVISGLQTIARETETEQATNHRPSHRPAAVQQPSPHAQPWTKLPNGLAKPPSPTPKSQPSPGSNSVKSPAQKADAKAASKSAAKESNAKAAPPPKAAAQSQAAQSKPAQSKPNQSKPTKPQPTSPVPATVLLPSSLNTLAPPQQAAPADPTNYGERYAQDISGKPVQNEPLIVLHETVGSADSAINTVQTPHPNERDQSSYHSIIRLDGTVVYVVPPEKRAYGAGNSVFQSFKGAETVRTHPSFPPSVNNFAYHISLETPPDGYNRAETHSGYTDAQYRSLAWLVAHTSVPDDRVTTHRAIDQSGSRIDPRSFDASRFYMYLRALPRPYLETAPG